MSNPSKPSLLAPTEKFSVPLPVVVPQGTLAVARSKEKGESDSPTLKDSASSGFSYEHILEQFRGNLEKLGKFGDYVHEVDMTVAHWEKKVPEEWKLLCPEERVSINLYTGATFKMKGFKGGNDPMIAILISALGKLPAYDKVVYRGETAYKKEKHGTWTQGSVIPFDKFLSTTTTRDTFTKPPLAQKTGVLIEFPPGHRGRYIAFASKKPEEEEVLFPRGSSFKVLEAGDSKYTPVHFTLGQV
jgi:hypothetical protein